MALEIKHKFQSAKADSGDATLIRPSNWNDTHAIQLSGLRLIGRTPSSAGDAGEIPLGNGLEFSVGSLQVKMSEVVTSLTITTALGYTPIQQGGGPGQTDDKIIIGYSAGERLLIDIDGVDMSDLWPIDIKGSTGKVRSAGADAGVELTFSSTVAVDPIQPTRIWGAVANDGLVSQTWDTALLTVGNATKLGGIAAASYAQFSTTSNPSETNLPPGSIVNVVGGSVNRNAVIAVWISATATQWVDSPGSAQMAGTWRGKGTNGAGSCIAQRTI